MNPLESLKQKLKIKPVVEEHVKVAITIPIPNAPEAVTLRNVTIKDERGDLSALDRGALLLKIKEAKLSKVTVALKKESEIKGLEIKEGEGRKKAKKITKKLLFTLEEEGIPIISKEEKDEKEEKEEKEVVNKRRTKRPVKGVVTIPHEEWVDIDELPTLSRLPVKVPHVNIKVSSYFMNNREFFVNFINSLFNEYREEFLSDEADISCDTIGSSSNAFSLLTHQKIVRDYLNVYTPYRGLLLFHGLGAGKTCTSIAIAEGFKSNKKVIIMTPASLRRNYMEELKKCGDTMYKKNQYWHWVSITKHPEALETLSSVLHLSVEYIQRKKGAWLVNVTQPSNYDSLESSEIKSLDDQLDEMIQYKYKFINYNGLRRDKLRDMTNNFESNIFDDAIVIIDEAHNFISRIVNKITKEKEIAVDKNGKKERVPYSLALILYDLLLSAKNARVVLLTGTPIINYPNEIGILFNILRGYIKTWEIPLDIQTGQSVTREKLQELFAKEKLLDYLDYSKDKVITITRNPFGFENKYKGDGEYTGVTNKKKETRGEDGKVRLEERGAMSDADFERRVISILENNRLSVNTHGIRISYQKALPDKFDEFTELFINMGTGQTKNIDLFKRRILGLASYFRSAQESLMPRYDKLTDFHVVRIPMSDYQFTVYELARSQERKQEKSSKQKKGVIDENGIYKDPSSTYRIFSRLYCNFVMPKPPGRPLPKEEREETAAQPDVEGVYEEALKLTSKRGEDGDAWDGELEGDEAIEKLADATYSVRIERAIDYVKEHEQEFLSPEGLQTYSPKYLNMLENIQDPEHLGLHLVYSQFRTLEGIGIFTMVLEANGFTRFKIKKDAAGVWNLDISEENRGKSTFALYTGTESAEEKEILRNIYNSQWDVKSPITAELKQIAHNNHMGEIIKVFMITAAGSEGINLRSTRYVHIMEPYWHPARIDQVIGRARRICSHKELPEALQTVEVYLYLMAFSPEQIKSEASIELKRKDLSKKKYLLPSKAKKSEGKEKEGKEGKEGEEKKKNKEKEKEEDKMDFVPFTSDQALYEISTIKEEVSSQLLTAIKEASIDCAIYSKAGNKEQLHCVQFGEPSTGKFAYLPNYKKEEPDTATKMNKKALEWRGKLFSFRGKEYIYRKIDKTHGNLYDVDSYNRALENPQIEPILVATTEQTPEGVIVRKI